MLVIHSTLNQTSLSSLTVARGSWCPTWWSWYSYQHFTTIQQDWNYKGLVQSQIGLFIFDVQYYTVQNILLSTGNRNFNHTDLFFCYWKWSFFFLSHHEQCQNLFLKCHTASLNVHLIQHFCRYKVMLTLKLCASINFVGIKVAT